MNRDQLLARYAATFITALTKRFEDTGEVDYDVCDKIESLLWPDGISPAPRNITHAYELEF